MRPGQFWLLMAASLLVSGLFIRCIFLERSLNREHAVLVDCQQTASTAVEYQRMWKMIALHLYQASTQDPAFVQLLKDEQIKVSPRASKPADAAEPATAPATTTPTNPVAPGDGAAAPAIENVKP